MGSGGHNKKTLEQHLADRTYRPCRHNPYRRERREPLNLERQRLNSWGWPGKREVAFLCDVSESTVSVWMKSGRMPPPSLQVGKGKHVWHPDILYVWLELGQPAAKEFDRLLEAAGEDDE